MTTQPNPIKEAALNSIPKKLHPWVRTDNWSVKRDGQHLFLTADGLSADSAEGLVFVSRTGNIFAAEAPSRKHRGANFARRVTAAEAERHILKYYGIYVDRLHDEAADDAAI